MVELQAIEIPPSVGSYLDLHHIVTLGTSSFTGVPHAATTAYASDHAGIYFVMPPDELTLRNIEANHWASFTIDDYTPDFRKVRELRGVGRCGPVAEADRARALELLRSKVPSVDESRGADVQCITPLVLDFTDFEYAEGVSVPRTSSISLGALDVHAITAGPISTQLVQRSLVPGEVLVRQGERAERIFIVVDGELEVRKEGHGQDVTVTRHGPGQLVGEVAALTGEPQSATFVAVTPSTVLAVDRESFQELVAGSGRADVGQRAARAASSLPPAGWYDDPVDSAFRRYWDGAAWTHHRAPIGGHDRSPQGTGAR